MSTPKNRDVLIIGGGIAGMQAALLLAEKDRRVTVVEAEPAIGGFFPLLDRQFPTNSCGVCFMSPKPPAYCPIYESEFHENITLLTHCELAAAGGQAGAFDVTLAQKPRFVSIDRCTLCGKCAEVCPVQIKNTFGGGLETRKAIDLPFAQAIPRSYAIDPDACTRCGECVKVCKPGAIDLDEKPREHTLSVGAIVLAFGFEPFQAELKGEYGFGRYANVVSSIQYERMLSYSGPTGGLPGRPSDNVKPKNVAFIQCVGSRDISCGREYCSSICCMYATKQAMMSKARDKQLNTTLFTMDVRAMGKDYERYYERARQEVGVRYVRSAVSTVKEQQKSKRLSLTYGLDNGDMKQEDFDMVVLSLGFTPPNRARQAADLLGVDLNEYGFCQTDEFHPTETSVPGVLVAGAVREPCDIPDTVVQASSAAGDVSALLDADVERTETGQEKNEPRNLPPDEIMRIGVFFCDNKQTLGDGVDLDALQSGIAAEDDIECVVSVEVRSLQAAVSEISAKIQDGRLNRVILAGHRGLTLLKGLKREQQALDANPCLAYYANIGEQCANVHNDDKARATDKAEHLLRASLRKARRALPRAPGRKDVHQHVLVVGGGMAGLSAALALAAQQHDVTLVEKTGELGGNARAAHHTLKGADVPPLVADLARRANEHPRIDLRTKTELKRIQGTWGAFQSLLATTGAESEIAHGAVIFATGGRETQPKEYLYGESDRVCTQREFERMLAERDPRIDNLRTVVMIQCVGSRDEDRPYCSRVCCGHAMKNVLKLKTTQPNASVTVLYRDIRTYGFNEKYYLAARNMGAIFVRYEPDSKPEVRMEGAGPHITFEDTLAGGARTLEPDLLVLSTGIEPNPDNVALGQVGHVDLNPDGFFAEANPKAAPLDAIDRGKYFCGLCHSPQHIEEAICQGKAAAARASALLWKGEATFVDNQAYVVDRLCSACGLCVSACPYEARTIDTYSNVAQVHADLCKGCGTCVISCPNGASRQYDYERSTVLEILDDLL